MNLADDRSTNQSDVKNIVEQAKHLVVLQADNPDGDSLGSALALEQIFTQLGKDVSLYCGVNIPQYLHYLEGWDRVQNELPGQFDASVFVDVNTETLFKDAHGLNQRGQLSKKPAVILDHHQVSSTIPYATVVINYPVVATAEVIYELAQALEWPLNLPAKKALLSAIMSDSLGLTSEVTTARSIAIVSELVEGGVSIAEIEYARRNLSRKKPEILHYKGVLLQRVEYYSDNRIAIVTIPWEEIEKYSYDYNPSMLVLDDMRTTINTDVAIAFKLYKDGKITAKVRCNYAKGIGSKLAEHFGGGGHAYASGYKIMGGRDFDEVKSESIRVATELLDKLNEGSIDETFQHTDT